jgi:hypothetical protein
VDSDRWNTVADWIRRITALILRYPIGLSSATISIAKHIDWDMELYPATIYPQQRKMHYAVGRHWLFYPDGDTSQYVVVSSTDGVNWSEPITIRQMPNGTYSKIEGRTMSVFFDGTYFHYAIVSQIDIYHAPTAVFYRRFKPNSDGTITWSADEQQAVPFYSNWEFSIPNICVDESGYPWITYTRYDGSHVYPYITTSDHNDGTWNTRSGFPYGLSTAISSGWNTAVVPLGGVKVLALFTLGGQSIHSKVWNGSSWGEQKDTPSSLTSSNYFCVVGGSDVADVVFMHNEPNGSILHSHYTYATDSWGSENVLETNVSWESAPVICSVPSSGDLYCFWAEYPEDNHIYYKRYHEGDWSSDPTDWITETDYGITYGNFLTCVYSADSHLSLAYITGDPNQWPYSFDLKYAWGNVG